MSTLHVKLTTLLLALTAAVPSHALEVQEVERFVQMARQLVDAQEVSGLLSRFGGEANVTLHPFADSGAQSAAGSQEDAEDAASLPAGKEVSLEFRGPLSQAIREIARQGGLSVMVQGALDQEVQVNLHGLSARRVLEALAEEHALSLTHRNGLIMIAPRSRPPSALEAQLPPPPPRVVSIPTRSEEEARRLAMALAMEPHLGHSHLHDAFDASEEDGRNLSEEIRRGIDEGRREFEDARKDPDGVRVIRVRSNRDGKPGRDLVVTGRSETVPEGQTVNDVVIYGGSLDLKGKATGNVLVFGGNADVQGSIQGDALIFGGQMRVEGTVDGDVLAMGGNVDLGPDAKVRGSVRALGGHVKHANGAQVQGSLEDDAPQASSHAPGFFSRAGSWLGTLLTRFVLLFGLGFLSFMLFPARMRVLTEDFKSRPGSALGLGFFAMLALVPLIILLCITIVGIPIALLLIPLVPLLVAMGLTAIALELGRRIPVLQGRQKTQASALAVGLVPLVFVSTLPGIGFLVIFVLSLVALGSMVRTRVGSRGRDPLPTTID